MVKRMDCTPTSSERYKTGTVRVNNYSPSNEMELEKIRQLIRKELYHYNRDILEGIVEEAINCVKDTVDADMWHEWYISGGSLSKPVDDQGKATYFGMKTRLRGTVSDSPLSMSFDGTYVSPDDMQIHIYHFWIPVDYQRLHKVNGMIDGFTIAWRNEGW